MSERFTMPPPRRTTQAAEGLPRWRWTTAELERVTAAGLFTEYDRFELLGGEMVPMIAPAERRHETIRHGLGHRMTRLAPEGTMVASVPQFNLSPDTFVKPDLLVHPDAIYAYDLKGSDVWLVVEVAELSLKYDLGIKLALYASHGIPEYWVINAETLVTTMHHRPYGTSYAVATEVPPDVLLVPSLARHLAISMNEVDLD
jgi:Uma2 family endonuclease